MKKLFIFDMDGTLLPDTTANLEISKMTQTSEQLQILEKEFSENLIDTRGFAEAIFKLWGIPEDSVLDEVFNKAPKLKNIKKVMKKINDENNVSCLITMSPDFFANKFYDYGFHTIFAAGFPQNSLQQLDLSRILVPEDKPGIAMQLSRDLGIDKNNIYAFGDSMSDYPLFKNLKNTVSVNGDEVLQRLTRFHYEGNCLYEAYNLLNI